MSAEQGIPRRLEAAVEANRGEGGANHRIRLCVPSDWPRSVPGQFLMLSPGARGAVPRFDPLLPRPMAIYRSERGGEGVVLEVLYKVTGRGTALLAEAREGQRVGVVGPLGRGFRAPAAGEGALLVGGGTGIASLHDLAAEAVAQGPTRVLLGARSAADLMGVDDFRALEVDLRIATEDGSEGERGRVTQLLEAALAEGFPGGVYACGPTPMMLAAARIAGGAGRACQVSLENRMACGYGVCLGCAVPRADRGAGFHLVCRDGPVFGAEELSWEGLP